MLFVIIYTPSFYFKPIETHCFKTLWTIFSIVLYCHFLKLDTHLKIVSFF